MQASGAEQSQGRLCLSEALRQGWYFLHSHKAITRSKIRDPPPTRGGLPAPPRTPPSVFQGGREAPPKYRGGGSGGAGRPPEWSAGPLSSFFSLEHWNAEKAGQVSNSSRIWHSFPQRAEPPTASRSWRIQHSFPQSSLSWRWQKASYPVDCNSSGRPGGPSEEQMKGSLIGTK